MPPRAKEHDHRVTHTSQDEFLVILAFFSIKKYDLILMRRVFRQRWTMLMNAGYCYGSSYALACGALEIGPLDERAAEYSRRFGKHMHMLPLLAKVQLSAYQRAEVQLLDCL